MDDSHVWRKVRGIEVEDYSGHVYNLEVEGDNSYVAEGIGVHNCNPHGATSAQMLARAAAGMTFDLLSPCFVYALINGGHDGGSVPSDAMDTLIKTGACLESEFPEGHFHAGQIPQSAYQTARRFRVAESECYSFDTFDELVTACLLDYHCFFTVRAGGAWGNVGADGVAPVLRGPGNHVTCGGEDVDQLPSGEWIVKSRNSWDATWGAGGYYNYREAHMDNQSYFQGYALKAALSDPTDPSNPPKVA